MHRFPLLSIFLSFVLLVTVTAAPASSEAELSGSDRSHAQSAFLFADKLRWTDALIHAKRARNPLLLKTVQWMYYREPMSGASFQEIRRFIEQNPQWPDQELLQRRAEEALLISDYSDDDVEQWFKSHLPVSGAGKLVRASILERKQERREIPELVREGWKDADMDASQEENMLRRFSGFLSAKDHIARVDRLLWERKTTPAERILNLLPADQQKLAKARIALINDRKTAAMALSAVPGKLQNDPGLIYDRMMYRYRRDDAAGVEDMLLAAPKKVPYPDKWWKAREKRIRDALASHNINKAVRLLANHGQTEGAEYAEALWLSGWVKYEHQHKYGEAYKDFYALFQVVKYPVSKARGAYWAGQAARKNGNKDIAKNWFSQAAAFPTTFYGQLAAQEITPHNPLHLTGYNIPSSGEKKDYQRRELPRVVQLLAEAGEYEMAHKFTLYLVDNADSAKEAALAASLGQAIHRPEDSVKAAKRALQKNFVLTDLGYPQVEIPRGAPLERPLILAISRQESEFDQTAKSPAGALGLMQLLPSTAKHVAKKLKMGYSPTRLYERDYNIRIGSQYLDELVDRFDGSYIKAIAAYNAGPGRVRQWEKQFGIPGNQPESAVRWIENIPFSETRNYVQRVIENLQVYRRLLADKNNIPHLSIEEDITR